MAAPAAAFSSLSALAVAAAASFSFRPFILAASAAAFSSLSVLAVAAAAFSALILAYCLSNVACLISSLSALA
jgi:hypothetical protein